MNPEDLHPVMFARHSDLDLAVEPSRAAKGRVDGIETVGCADHHHLLPLLESVHHGEELCHHTTLNFASHILAPGRNGIEFIDEDDGRCIVLGLLKDLAKALFTFSIVFGDNLRASDGDEVGPALIRDRLRNESLSSAGRAEEEHPLGRLDTQFLKKLRMAHGEFYRLPDTLQLRLQSADILVGNTLDPLKSCRGFFGKFDLGIPGDDDRIFRLHDHRFECHELRLHERHPGLNRDSIIFCYWKIDQPVDNLVVIE